MDKIKPRTLSGFMELQPDKQVQMDKMRAVLAETYARYGFTPLDTPAIEAAEVLLAKGGGETEKQIYRFTKGESDLALRFDLTVPLAKYVAANYGQLTFPFRRYQIGKVWRGERAQRGRFREFYQADIDIIGDGALDILNEAEIPAIIYDTFTRLGLHRFRIRVNNRKVLNGFFAILGLSEQAGDVLRTIDKLDKIGADKVRALLTDTCGVTVGQADEILRETLEESGQNKPSTQAFAVLADFSSAFLDGVPRYVVILRAVNASGEGTIHVRRLPQDVLERAAERIMKETPRVYRVVYDLSAVPPAHVEWE